MWSWNDSSKFAYRLCLTTCMGFCEEYQVRTECWLPPCSQLLRNSGVLSWQQICVPVPVYIWHLKYFSNITGQEIILFRMCELINGCLQLWIIAKCLFLGLVREITVRGAKICFLCHVYFRICGMGNKAWLPFPGGTEAGFRGDCYLLPVLDKERIEETNHHINLHNSSKSW